jgi:predicted PurR-regulated permease PerM
MGIITALLDALPLIGAGLVYGIVASTALFTGDIRGAIIVLLGYIGAVFLRQFLEQKLVSSLLGLHPLVIIIGLFLALTPLGFIGMFYFLGGFFLYRIISPPK